MKHRRRWYSRLREWAAGGIAGLVAARTASGHEAGLPSAAVESSAGTVPDPVAGVSASDREDGSGSPIGNPFGHFSDTRVFEWLAMAALGIRTGLAWVGAAVAVVILPVVLGIGRIISVPAAAVSGWLKGGRPVDGDFDEYGDEPKSRRLAPFWLLFTGFYMVVALVIAANIFLAAAPAAASSPGHVAAATTPTPGATQVATSAATSGAPAGPADSVRPGESGAATITSAPSGAAPSTAPTTAPIATPSPTAAGPTPTVAPTITPVATPTPTLPPVSTPTPAPTPTPTPTPAPTAVPSRPFLDTQEPSPLAVGTNYTFWIVWISNSKSCFLTRVYVSGPTLPAPGPASSTTRNITSADGWLGMVWGATAPAGTYSVTATCTAPGSSTPATSLPITVAWQ